MEQHRTDATAAVRARTVLTVNGARARGAEGAHSTVPDAPVEEAGALPCSVFGTITVGVIIEPDSWRAMFESATEGLVELVDDVEASQWSGPGLGMWDLRDLVGHTSRALLTIEMYLARDSGTVTLDSPIAYFLAASATSGSKDGNEAIAQRGRDAGAALGPEPAAGVRTIAERVVALVDRTADDAPCTTPVGGILLAAYLPTRTYELTVHSLDIASALGVSPPEQLDEPVRACLDLVATTIGATPRAAEVLLALTGRRELPRDLRVI